MDVFYRARFSWADSIPRDFYRDGRYSGRCMYRAERGHPERVAHTARENREHRTADGTVTHPHGNAAAWRNPLMRRRRGRLARSVDRASVALSGGACLLRAGAERGMIDQFAMPCGERCPSVFFLPS
ncbi:hypothetical protein [Burkholderia diffusa]|uniref:hypothetical protein n=1 Tax=Burkholderia diffusa TaxID=488732 RepID=UPI002AB2C2C4|nr:hypothetical protein [Burkholderia diffusa]